MTWITRLLSVGCLLLVTPALPAQGADPKEEAAAAALKKVGGTVQTDNASPGKPVVGVLLSYSKATDDDLAHLKAFPKLRTLNLYNAQSISDDGLKHLEELTGLEELNLGSTKITDKGMERLKNLKKLRSLYLP